MTNASYMNATGPIDYGMTNDYMFRSVLQRNTTVLKGLICSMLHLSPDDVSSVVITNPIELGEDIIRTSGDGIDLPDLDLTEI